MEKNNDMARSVVLRKSNKWDSAGDVLGQEKKQWELRNHERDARVYVKRKEASWDEEIKQTRQKRNKSHHSNQELTEAQIEHPNTEQSSTNNDKMTIKELKIELKQRNAKGFSHKNKAELIKQLEEICQGEKTQIIQQ